MIFNNPNQNPPIVRLFPFLVRRFGQEPLIILSPIVTKSTERDTPVITDFHAPPAPPAYLCVVVRITWSPATLQTWLRPNPIFVFFVSGCLWFRVWCHKYILHMLSHFLFGATYAIPHLLAELPSHGPVSGRVTICSSLPLSSFPPKRIISENLLTTIKINHNLSCTGIAPLRNNQQCLIFRC